MYLFRNTRRVEGFLFLVLRGRKVHCALLLNISATLVPACVFLLLLALRVGLRAARLSVLYRVVHATSSL